MFDDVASQLDAAHRSAKKAYVARDVVAYMDLFAPELQYTQADGLTIDFSHLAHDVQSQMARARTMDSSYRRQDLVVDGDKATELLLQDAWVDMVVFFFLKRRWRVQRIGRYHWAKIANRWKIVKVEVLHEKVI